MKDIGLYFGSFNPIHNGHLMVANYAVEHFNLDELHFIVSPQNPFKEQKDLLDINERIALCNAAIEGNTKFIINDIETKLPIPSYTTDTLNALAKEMEDCNFHIIMGFDNLISLHKWKNVENVLKCHLIVFPRVKTSSDGELTIQFENALKTLKNSFSDVNITFVENGIINNLSSTFVRNEIQNNKSVKYYIPDSVIELIQKNNFYKK